MARRTTTVMPTTSDTSLPDGESAEIGPLRMERQRITYNQVADIRMAYGLDAGVDLNLSLDLDSDRLGLVLRSGGFVDHPATDPIAHAPAAV